MSGIKIKQVKNVIGYWWMVKVLYKIFDCLSEIPLLKSVWYCSKLVTNCPCLVNVSMKVT